MSGVILPLLLRVFMEWTGAALHLEHCNKVKDDHVRSRVRRIRRKWFRRKNKTEEKGTRIRKLLNNLLAAKVICLSAIRELRGTAVTQTIRKQSSRHSEGQHDCRLLSAANRPHGGTQIT